MSYYATHRKNILGSMTINKNDIQPGDILEFRYRGKSKSSLEIVLCLNELVRDKEKKLHALKLENISLSQFKQVLDGVGSPKLMLDVRKNKEVIKVVVAGESEGERQKFYNDVVKRFNKFDVYRTYISKNMTSIKLVEYDFGVKQLGLKNENLLQDTDA
jgi:hypothetical protein